MLRTKAVPVSTLPLFPVEAFEHVRAGVTRATTSYGVHAYHTKVPAEGIEPFLRQHTAVGQTVLDPFCGSGMTGLAARRLGRRPMLSDISPAAVHIAGNYTTPCDPVSYLRAAARALALVQSERDDLYRTMCHQCGGGAETAYLIWSDVRACPTCRSQIRVWDQRETGLRQLRCPNCGEGFRKGTATVCGEVPVRVNISCGSCGRLERDPSLADIEAAHVVKEAIPYWYPRVPFGRDRAMWRSGHEDLGIHEVADFYSPRNLRALAALWAALQEESDERLQSALKFTFTAIANRASRRYQWNAKRPTNVLGGTLYVSSLRYEFNVFGLWKRKVAAISRFFRETIGGRADATVIQASATSLPYASGTIDYCFTDPPFGGNIVYSDCSILWESWLGTLTDRASEAVISHTGKSIIEYADIMELSFKEMHRVLKPEAAATVVFQATNAAVWECILTAAANVGFAIEEVDILHKRQPSFKGVKAQKEGERVAASDVVLTLRRGSKRLATTVSPQFEPIWTAVASELKRSDLSGRQRTSGHLYAVAVAAAIEAGTGTGKTTFEALERWLSDNCLMRDGEWQLVEDTVVQ